MAMEFQIHSRIIGIAIEEDIVSLGTSNNYSYLKSKLYHSYQSKDRCTFPKHTSYCTEHAREEYIGVRLLHFQRKRSVIRPTAYPRKILVVCICDSLAKHSRLASYTVDLQRVSSHVKE